MSLNYRTASTPCWYNDKCIFKISVKFIMHDMRQFQVFNSPEDH